MKAGDRIYVTEGLRRGRRGAVVETRALAHSAPDGMSLIEVRIDGWHETTLERMAWLAKESLVISP